MAAPPSTAPLRVCLVTERYPPQSGGVAVAAARLVRILVAEGFEVHVVHPAHCPGREMALESCDEQGVMVHRIHYDDWGPDPAMALYRCVSWLHGQHTFDVLHAFFLTVAHATSFANHHPNLPHAPRWVIASARGTDALSRIFYPWWRETIREALAAESTWLTCVNRTYIGHLERELGLDLSGRSTTIYNGVAPVPRAERWRLGAHNRGVVGTIGAFRPIKDVPLCIRAYGGVEQDLRGGLLLGGFFDEEGVEEEAWCEVLFDELGCRDEVEITGRFPHAEVGGLLRRMHVYVQSSAYEGLPNAVLEAAAHGVPLVCTAVGGLAEIIEDGRSGLLVPHGEPSAMARAIARILADDVLAQRLSDGALELAATYSEEREAAAWRALYGQLRVTPVPPHQPRWSLPGS